MRSGGALAAFPRSSTAMALRSCAPSGAVVLSHSKLAGDPVAVATGEPSSRSCSSESAYPALAAASTSM